MVPYGFLKGRGRWILISFGLHLIETYKERLVFFQVCKFDLKLLTSSGTNFFHQSSSRDPKNTLYSAESRMCKNAAHGVNEP